MKTPIVIWLVIMSLVFGFCGWLCVFKTQTLVWYGRRNYERTMKSGGWFFRTYLRITPMSHMALKPWYPTFVRCMGIYIWFFAVTILYFVIFLHAR
jgi:hypothetical protein